MYTNIVVGNKWKDFVIDIEQVYDLVNGRQMHKNIMENTRTCCYDM